MTEVVLPTYRELMLPILQGLAKLGGSATVPELQEVVPDLAGLTEEQMAVEFGEGSMRPGESKVLNRIHWGCSALKQIGAADNSVRGVWAITPSGGKILELPGSSAVEALLAAHRQQRAEYRAARAAAAVAASDEESEQDDEGNSGDGWRSELLATLKSMPPAGFERLAMRLLREAGFRNVEVLGQSGDGGIDGVGVYKVSLVSFPTYFQCKRYAGSVAAGTVRDFRGAMTGRGEKGLIITTGSFTPAAKSEATRDGAPPIDLIDGEELCELLKDYGLGVSVETRTVEDVTVKPDYFETV